MNTQEINVATGGQLTPVGLSDINGVRQAFNELLSRVQALPFVPSNWLTTVQDEVAKSAGAIWQPRYAINAIAWRAGKTEPVLGDTPSWLTGNPQAATAWNKLADWWTERMQPILRGWARDQAEVMNAANADARFWDTLYNSVKPIADLGETIIAAPEKVGEVVSRSFLGALRGFAPVLLIAGAAGVAFLVYKSGAYKRLAK